MGKIAVRRVRQSRSLSVRISKKVLMKRIFADSVYWIALINPADQWFQAVHAIREHLYSARLVSTGEVLTETMNYYAEAGQAKRIAASTLVRSILLDIEIEIVPATEMGFFEGLDFYERRQDKGYSLTDCISMNVCRSLGITEVLTHDDHFRQEGFNILL
jgi:uncharacterized protein